MKNEIHSISISDSQLIVAPAKELNVSLYIEDKIPIEIDIAHVVPTDKLIELFDATFKENKTQVTVLYPWQVKYDVDAFNKCLAEEVKPYRLFTVDHVVQSEKVTPDSYIIKHYMVFNLREFDFKDLVLGE